MIKKLFLLLGFFFVGIAFIGVFLPGIPTTFPAIVAAWLFSKSSPKWNKWIHTNKFFGYLVTQWEEKRIYPLWGKFAQYGVLFLSNLFFHIKYGGTWSWVFTIFTIGLVIWSLPYPTGEKDYQKRIKENKKLGWIK